MDDYAQSLIPISRRKQDRWNDSSQHKAAITEVATDSRPMTAFAFESIGFWVSDIPHEFVTTYKNRNQYHKKAEWYCIAGPQSSLSRHFES